MEKVKVTRNYEWNEMQVEYLDNEAVNRVRVRRTYYATNPNRIKTIESIRKLAVGEGIRLFPIVDERHIDRLRSLAYSIGKHFGHRYSTYQVVHDDGSHSVIVERLPDNAKVVSEQEPF